MYLMNLIEDNRACLSFESVEEPYFRQCCEIRINEDILTKFLYNYDKVSEIFKNDAYPDSIKNSVRNTLIDEYIKEIKNNEELDFEEITLPNYNTDLPF